MARGRGSYNVESFARGLNTAARVSRLADGEASNVVNLVSDQGGSLSTRGGTRTWISFAAGAAVGSVSAVEPGDPVSGGHAKIVCSVTRVGSPTTDINVVDTAVGTSTTVTTTPSTDPWKFLRLPAISSRGPYWGMNGRDTPLYITATNTSGTWTATTGTVPNGRFMVYANNRVWVAGVASNPNAIYWSEIGDPTNWPTANVTQFDPNDGEAITGLAAIGSYLMVFKGRSIWRVYDLDTSANVRVTSGAGTVDPRSIVTVDDECFFLDQSLGVCTTDGQRVVRLSDQVLGTVTAMAGAGAAVAAYWRGSYYLTAGNQVLQYDTNLKSWWTHDVICSLLFTQFASGNPPELNAVRAERILYAFDPFFTNDDGTAIVASWTSGRLDMGQPQVAKRVRQLVVSGTSSGAFTVTVTRDFDTVTDTYTTLPEEPIFSPGASQTFRFSISGSGATTLTGVQALYDIRHGRA